MKRKEDRRVEDRPDRELPEGRVDQHEHQRHDGDERVEWIQPAQAVPEKSHNRTAFVDVSRPRRIRQVEHEPGEHEEQVDAKESAGRHIPQEAGMRRADAVVEVPGEGMMKNDRQDGDPAQAIDESNSIQAVYSTVTDFARLRGWSTSQPRRTAMSYARS